MATHDDRHDDRRDADERPEPTGPGTGRPSLRPGASQAEIELEIARTREEFARTLDAIEDKFDLPAHARRLTASVRRRLDDDPAKVVAPVLAGVAGVAAIVAGIVKARR